MFSESQIKNLKDQKILVTGCSGQIGTRLIKKFSDYGIEVSGIDIKPPEKSCIFNFIKCDITKISSIKKASSKFKKINSIIHLASVINDSTDVLNCTVPSIDLNLIGTLNLIENLPNLGYICFTSSYMVYGQATYNPIDEMHPTYPQNIYGVSKLATEKFLKVISRSTGIGLGILRMMGVYGPGTPAGGGRAIPSFIKKIREDESPIIYGSGKSRRNYLYIDDCINAILLASSRQRTGTWNIGGKESWSVLRIAKSLISLSNKNVNLLFRDNNEIETDFICSIDKAKDELGYFPETNLKDGLKLEYHDYIRGCIC